MPGEPDPGADRPEDVAHVPADLADLVPTYLARLRADLGAATQALARRDLAALQTFGHKSAGSGGSYGFPEVTRLGREIEAGAKAKDLEGLTSLLERMERHLERVRVVIEDEEN